MFDRPSADDPWPAPGGLETELRAALEERSAGITTATLLRPDPPGLSASASRPPVTRWRIVGAVAAVSAVILAVVIGRGVMAPQQMTTGAPVTSTAAEPADESQPPADRLTDQLWAASSIVTSGNSFSVSTWATSNNATMFVEFSREGTVVFHDGNNEVRGRYTTGRSSITVSDARGWESPAVSRTDLYLQETFAVGALLKGMPGAVTLQSSLVGPELTLTHGTTTVVFSSLGVSPDAAVLAGAGNYPLAAVVGETWQAATVDVRGHNVGVSTPAPITVALAADGTFVVDMAGAVLRGRWWATGDGLAVTDVVGSGTSVLYEAGALYGTGSAATFYGESPLNAAVAAAASIGSGDVTVSFAAQGAQLVVTPRGEPRIPVTFVRR